MLVKNRLYRILFLAGLLLNSTMLLAQTDITDLSQGSVTAQYSDSPSGEDITKVIDNNTNTKYLTFHNTGWIEFRSPSEYIITKYTITSANDVPDRDPSIWTLVGSNDRSNWNTLDERSGQIFSSRFQKKTYTFSNNTAYKYFRLIMTCKNGSTLQLAEWELFTAPMTHDVGVSGISVKVDESLSPLAPTVIVKNYGTSTENFPVTCIITKDNQQVYNQTQNATNVTSGNTQNVSFPQWQPDEDVQYKVTAFTSLSTDQVNGNDTLILMANTKKKVYLVGYSHLDLQWNWNLGTTINEYIPNTLRGNFALFEKYPDYRFNFEASYRYKIMKEKYPSDYAKLKDYIAQGKWFIAGSMVEATDVIVPSPEALMRQILYGNKFFEEEFGKKSIDILLPDCFGFPYTLPTIASHCGLKGFSTQKFDRWGGSFPSPFSIGQWEGVDGSRIVAVLKPGAYDNDPEIREIDLMDLGNSTGVYMAYDYYGRRGDIGGPPPDSQVEILESLLEQNNTSDIEVISASSDQIFRDLTDEQISQLDVYKGELLMTLHGTGCYTSHADLKLLNRKNELTANAAERASVSAELFTGKNYPADEFEESWIRFLAHGFHDDLTGTSIQSAYTLYTLPDYEKSLNSFTGILNDANKAIADKIDTRVDDASNTVSVVVSNPLSFDRRDIAEAEVQFAGAMPEAVRVFDKVGKEVPSQIKSVTGQSVTIVFMANVPPVGYTVYHVKKSDTPCQIETGLKVTTNKLENNRYVVSVDDYGDVESIYDKLVGEELFQGSSKFELRDDFSSSFPAWEIYYDDVTAPPRSFAEHAVQKAVVDSGSAQVTLKVTRANEGSYYTHYYTLTADDEGFLRVDNTVDWNPSHPNGSLLKVSFYLTASNPKATYDLGIGAVQRGNNTRQLYEVPAQQWADISNPDDSYGVAILSNCKYGWDKPWDDLIQLTLIHTPKGGNYTYQGDKYVHNFSYGIYGHTGNWAEGNVISAGQKINQPLIAFQTSAHDGGLGKEFSFVNANPAELSIMAIKKAEYGDDYIIRVREVAGQQHSNVKLKFAGTVLSAEESNGVEEYKQGVSFSSNELSFDINPYQPKTFRVKLKNPYPTNTEKEDQTVSGFRMYDPYPNPSNSAVTISFDLPDDDVVKVKIYNQLGQEVATLVDKMLLSSGMHKLNWDQVNDFNHALSSGIYFVRIETSGKSAVKKITILK